MFLKAAVWAAHATIGLIPTPQTVLQYCLIRYASNNTLIFEIQDIQRLRTKFLPKATLSIQEPSFRDRHNDFPTCYHFVYSAYDIVPHTGRDKDITHSPAYSQKKSAMSNPLKFGPPYSKSINVTIELNNTVLKLGKTQGHSLQ